MNILATLAGVYFSVGGLQSEHQGGREKREGKKKKKNIGDVRLGRRGKYVWDQFFRENDKWDQQEGVDVALARWQESAAAYFAESLCTPHIYISICTRACKDRDINRLKIAWAPL